MTIYKNQSGIVLRGGGSPGDVFDTCNDVLIVGRAYASAGSAPDSYGLSIKNCTNVRILDCDFADFGRGVVISKTTGFNVSACRFVRQKIDGINFAQSWRGSICDNRFTDPETGEAHPDAIQGWSRPDLKPTSDIYIARNDVEGMLTQGVFLGNHVRQQPVGFKPWNGPVLTVPTNLDDGGFDRITIVDNFVRSGMPQGVHLGGARKSIVQRNHVETMAGAQFVTSINLDDDIDHSGNTAAAYGKHPAWSD